MKKFIFIILSLSFFATSAFAQEFRYPKNFNKKEKLTFFFQKAIQSRIYYKECINVSHAEPDKKILDNLYFIKEKYFEIYQSHFGMDEKTAKGNLEKDTSVFEKQISQYFKDTQCNKENFEVLYREYMFFEQVDQKFLNDEIDKILAEKS